MTRINTLATNLDNGIVSNSTAAVWIRRNNQLPFAMIQFGKLVLLASPVVEVAPQKELRCTRTPFQTADAAVRPCHHSVLFVASGEVVQSTIFVVLDGCHQVFEDVVPCKYQITRRSRMNNKTRLTGWGYKDNVITTMVIRPLDDPT